VPAMRVDVRPYRELTPHEIEEWEDLVRKVYPPGEARSGSELRWADLDEATDYLVQLHDDSELRACAWVTRQTISSSGRELRVAGVRGVLTDPEHRRRGYASAVMDQAQTLMRSFGDCDVAVLFSSVMAVPFYESFGWRALPGPVTVEQPDGRIDYTEALPTAPVMALPLRRGADLPLGRIDVHGLPW
jgi:GNAT superfamily N-acetyltransferase